MKAVASSRVRARKFFKMSGDLTKNPPGLVLQNEDQVKEVNRRTFTATDPWFRGFSRHPEGAKPLFRHSKRKGRKPLDLEPMGGYWLITEGTKAVFDDIDPSAFEFMPCEISYDDGSPTVRAWVCDVVRFVDALDEGSSDVRILFDSRKHYYLAGARRLVFKPDVVGSAHVFRIAHAPTSVICDDVLRRACKDAKLKSLSFMDAIKKKV